MKNRIIKSLLVLLLVFSSLTPYSSIFAESEEAKIEVTELEKQKKAFPEIKDKRVELTTKRTANEKVFANPNGSFTTEVYADPVHYKQKNGTWKEIDNELVEKGNSFENKANNFKTKLKEVPSQEISLDDYFIKMTPKDASETKGKNKENSMTYKDVYPHTDFIYTTLANSLKEDIVLQNNNAQTTFEFNLHTNLTPKINEFGHIEFHDKDKAVFTSYKPYAFDASGIETEDVHYSLKQVNDQNYTITVTLDQKWFNDNDRVFPITIDPTITYTSEIESITDVYVNSLTPTLNNEGKNFVNIGTSTGSGVSRSYFDIKLPSLISGATIADASFKLYQFIDTADNQVAQLIPITKSWDPKTINYNTQPTVDSTKAMNLPARKDIGNWVFDKNSLTNSDKNLFINFIKDVYAGKQNYYGFQLRAQNEALTHKSFITTEVGNGNVPVFSITYKVSNEGSEDFWAFDNGVNLLTGNYVLHETDYTLDGKGVPITLSRSYNSQSVFNSPQIGQNWRFGVDMRITPNTTTDTKAPVTLTDDDGTSHVFIYDSAKGEYEAPAGIQLKFWYDIATNYRYVEDKNGTKYKFNIYGYLDSIIDKNENVMKVSRDANISKLTDDSGREIIFDYSTPNVFNITGDVSILPFELHMTKVT